MTTLANLIGLGACYGASRPMAVILGLIALLLGVSGLLHWSAGAPRIAAVSVLMAFGLMAAAVRVVLL